MIKAKAELYKLFFLGVAAQSIYMIVNKLNESTEVIISIKDLMTRQDLRDNDIFKVVSQPS